MQVSGQLLHTVDLAVALDLHSHRGAGSVAAQQVHGTDGGRELPAHQGEAILDGLGVAGEELLKLRFHSVLLQTGIGAHLVGALVEDLLDPDRELIAATGSRNPPHARLLVDDQPVGRVHPIERLVGAAVGVDGHAAVGLDHDQTHRRRQMGLEPAVVVDGAAGDHEPHRRQVSALARYGRVPRAVAGRRPPPERTAATLK